ncbi:MAG: LptF/LptG family permease [Planctomycetota bacterium]
MLIIDRYLLRQFLQTIVVCYVSLTGLYIVFDAFTNMDEFLRCGEKSGGVLHLMASFYGYQSIVFFDRTAGLLNLIAAMFTVAWIQRHNELTALMAAGISRFRVARPVLIAVAVILLAATFNREVVIPRCREQLSRRPQDLIGDKAQLVHPLYDNRTYILLWGKATYGNEQRIEEPDFQLPRSLEAYGTNRLKAAQAYYRAPTDDRPGGYLLERVSEPKQIDTRPSLRLDGEPVILTRSDTAWLEPGQCFVVSGVTFEQLSGGRTFRDYASTAQLIESLRNPSLDMGADVRVAIHARIVQPLIDMTLLMLGLPLVLTRQNRNVFVAIGMCLAVVTVFVLSVLGLQYLGTSLLIRPALAAWAPLLIFVPAAAWMASGLWE